MSTSRISVNDRAAAAPVFHPTTGGGAVMPDDPAALVDAVLSRRLVTPMFQPIVELAGRRVVGAEALARGPAGSPVENPERLLGAAKRVGRLAEMDMLCTERALEEGLRAAYPLRLLFVNAEPAAFGRRASARLLDLLRRELPFRIVLEFTERALGANPAGLLTIADRVHRMGDGLALDDVGADPMSLALLPLIEPEVIKLDMHLLRDPFGRATVELCSIVTATARRSSAVVLAEGIETEADLRHARALGATWGQGWLFGRPMPVGELPRSTDDPVPTLRAARPGLHLPTGTPFELASAGGAVRVSGTQLVDAMLAQLLRDADRYGDHAVVLATTADPATASQWAPEMQRLARRVAYAAVVGPVPKDGQAAFAVIGPHFAGALCARRRADQHGESLDDDTASIEFVLTYDRRTVENIGRSLLRLAPIRE